MSILETDLDRPNDGAHCDAGPLPVDPFQSLRPHFGMLLGVDDFETVDAYHRGKTWLHSAWLHRQGVVWGLGVGLLPLRGEVEVAPGLAVDALGRELQLDTAVCLNVGRWYSAHEDDEAWAEAGEEAREVSDDGDTVTFTAHVVAQAKRCLARQVPALVEPCDGDGHTTAYSRVEETVELRLVPGPAPNRGSATRPLPYHRLRLLFAVAVAREEEVDGDTIVVAADQEVLDARAAVLALDPADQPAACLEAFRRFAALDAMDLQPAAEANGFDGGTTLFPGAEPGAMVLAGLQGVVVRRQDEETWAFDPNAEPEAIADNTVRDVHIATTTVQELLCGAGIGGAFAGNGEADPEDDPEAGEEEEPVDEGEDAGVVGPRAQPDSVQTTARQVSVELDAPVLASTLTAEAVGVSVFDESEGWRVPTTRRIYFAAGRSRLIVQTDADLPTGTVRLVIRGTGATPVLGVDRVPFAGSAESTTAGRHDGNDFVHMIER